MENEKRQSRMSKIQKEHFISLLEKNRFLIETKLKPHEITKAKTCWSQIAETLNELPGANKSVKEWKYALNEMKVNARRKARLINVGNKGTGGGPKTVKDLTDLEERILALLSKVVITGLPGTTELGIVEEEECQNDTFENEENVEHSENVEIAFDIDNVAEVIEFYVEEPSSLGSGDRNVTSRNVASDRNVSSDGNVTQKTPNTPKSHKKRKIETNTERLAKKHEKCLKVLADSSNNLATACLALARVKYRQKSAVFSLKF